MAVVGFNANRIAGDAADELVEELVRRYGRCVFCLQEVGSWNNEVCIEGFHLFHFEGNPSAILIPQDLATSICDEFHGLPHQGVIMGNLAVISFYPPDSSKSLEEYVSAYDT